MKSASRMYREKLRLVKTMKQLDEQVRVQNQKLERHAIESREAAAHHQMGLQRAEKQQAFLQHQIEYYKFALEEVADAAIYRQGSCAWISLEFRQVARLALKRVFTPEGERNEKSNCDRRYAIAGPSETGAMRSN